MYSSAMNRKMNNWTSVIHHMFDSSYQKYDLAQLSSSLWEVMEHGRLTDLLSDLLEESDIFVSDNWSIDTPPLLIANEEYNGNFVIDMSGCKSLIRINHFCFSVNLAMIFYAEHIDEKFSPWKYIPNIDSYYLKFSNPDIFNKKL